MEHARLSELPVPALHMVWNPNARFNPMNYFMFIRMEACLLFTYADII
jgi:hypothetical protein